MQSVLNTLTVMRVNDFCELLYFYNIKQRGFDQRRQGQHRGMLLYNVLNKMFCILHVIFSLLHRKH